VLYHLARGLPHLAIRETAASALTHLERGLVFVVPAGFPMNCEALLLRHVPLRQLGR
jgi:hypothetical protein